MRAVRSWTWLVVLVGCGGVSANMAAPVSAPSTQAVAPPAAPPHEATPPPTQQSEGEGIALVCSAPEQAPGASSAADEGERARLMTVWTLERVTNGAALTFFQDLGYLSPTQRESAMRAKASSVGLSSCVLADYFARIAPKPSSTHDAIPEDMLPKPLRCKEQPMRVREMFPEEQRGGVAGQLSGQSSTPLAPLGPKLRGSLSKDVIRDRIQAQIGDVRQCYELALTVWPQAQGKVIVQFLISPDGSVKAAEVQSNDAGPDGLGCCIANKVSRWSFPKPDGGGIVIVSYPFVLEASQ